MTKAEFNKLTVGQTIAIAGRFDTSSEILKVIAKSDDNSIIVRNIHGITTKVTSNHAHIFSAK